MLLFVIGKASNKKLEKLYISRESDWGTCMEWL